VETTPTKKYEFKINADYGTHCNFVFTIAFEHFLEWRQVTAIA